MTKTNLLFVFADQWRRSALGFAKDEPVQTPNMDKFAERGVWCTNAVSNCPLCSPHRASLFTGRHPFSTGVFTNCKTGLDIRLQDNEICIGDVFKQNGYATAYIGKWHLDEPEQNHTKSPPSGAKNWDAYTPPGPRRHGFDKFYSYGACDEHLRPHYWEDSPEMLQVNEWSPKHETDVAIDYIRQHKDDSFALFISWNPPHSPYDQVPDEYLQPYLNKALRLKENVGKFPLHHHTGEEISYDKKALVKATRQYYAAISGLDAQFARLIKTLEDSGLAENTLVVLSADHGDMMGSHGLMGKHTWYEESIGIPLIMSGAGLTAGRCETVIGSPDIMPTLLDLLQLPIPSTVEGESRASALKEQHAGGKQAFIGACPGRDVLLKEFASAEKNPMHYGWRALRTATHIYVLEIGYLPGGELMRRLYSLKDDPLQQNPLIINAQNQNKLAIEMESQLTEFLKQQKDGFIAHLQ